MSDELDLVQEDFLHNADNEILACAQGHDWPKLRPGGILPRGLMIDGPYHEGVMELIFTCKSCKTERRLVTAPHGHLELPAQYTYKSPAEYKSPKGHTVTRRMRLAETWRRCREDYLRIAQMQQREREVATTMEEAGA
jgi:hypothetical protein